MNIQNQEEILIQKVNKIDNQIKQKTDQLGKDFNLGNITQKEYKKQLKKIKSQKKKMETIFNEIVRIKELKGGDKKIKRKKS